ncbi:hypothetical protein C8F01DRAFT_1122201 [Mycena amicta]|nr:hypothetical protein C8F01DRAFT_1122201 [Mycena amicta]
MSKVAKRAVFALVIGINSYFAPPDDFPPLKGAVNDSRDFVQYLLDPPEKHGLGVPAENILHLENQQATRANIIASFRSHFLENEKILDHSDTTMILFFAGHGARMKVQDAVIEVLCPVDERTLDADGNPVYAIPDYILGWLLAELANKKGPNITVILDSCHSGGMNREDDDEVDSVVGLPRSAWSDSEQVPASLDADLWSSARNIDDTAKSYRLWAPSSFSHVLLAACRQEETAREETFSDGSVHGRFTSRLLSRLRGLPLHNTTYEELINFIPKWTEQTPHCGGRRRHGLVFDGSSPPTGEHSLTLERIIVEGTEFASSPSWEVKIGSVEGVVPGTEFAIRAPDTDDHVICTLVAQTVQLNRTVLAPDEAAWTSQTWKNMTRWSRAVVLNWKNTPMVARVYIPPTFPYASKLFPSDLGGGQLFVQAPSMEVADLSLRCEGEDVVIEWRSNMVRQVQPETRLRLRRQQLVRLPLIIDELAHFSYFLERHPASPMSGVSLEVHRLRGSFPVRIPDTNFGDNGNLVKNGVVRLVSDDSVDIKYGFTIRNDSERDLYPYLFYFDPVSYTISLWYEPPDGRVLSPLAAHSSLAIGMGTEPAIEFYLEEHETESSGFLKLFFATKSLDLAWIRRDNSPVDPLYGGRKRGEEIGADSIKDVEEWDALDVLVTMTR